MSRIFTSDWHLFHRAIIDYCNRPYSNINKMHQQLILRHNQVARPTDEVWVLGDVTLDSPEYAHRIRKVVGKFNGIKHLVIGNHDDWRPESYEKAGFLTVHTAMWYKHKGFRFFMMHDPAKYTAIQNDHKAILLCGHIHNTFLHLLPEKRVINVGVDVWQNPPSQELIDELLVKYGVM